MGFYLNKKIGNSNTFTMLESGGSGVVQVTNVSPGASSEQIKTLFTFLGNIEEIELYPKSPDNGNPITKMAFIKFSDSGSVLAAQHLTNTVFVDRALICVPYTEDSIPEESVAMQLPANIPPHVTQSSASVAPNVTANTDPTKLNEIQRTCYVGNLDSKNVTYDKLMTFFSLRGDVKCVRLAGDETQPTRFAFVEFATTEHVKAAIATTGTFFFDRPIKVSLSNNAIVKPQCKGTDSREMDEAMRRVREAQSLIDKALEAEKGGVKKPREKSRSPSRHHHRRRSRSSSRHRSRGSRHHRSSRRSHSRSRSTRKRSRSRSRDKRSSRSGHSRRRSRSQERRRRSSKSHRKKDERKRDRKHHKDDEHRSSKKSKKSSSDKNKEESATSASEKKVTPM